MNVQSVVQYPLGHSSSVHVVKPSWQAHGPLPLQSKLSWHGKPMLLPLLDEPMQLSAPLDELVPTAPDDELGPPDEDPDDDVVEEEPPGPSPFVVELQPTSRSVNTTVDFIPDRLPC